MNAAFAPHSTGSFPMMTGFSPLQLADRMLSLAQDADRAGDRQTASSLLDLMYEVLDRPCSGH